MVVIWESIMSGQYQADKEGSDLLLDQYGAGPRGFSRWQIVRERAGPMGPLWTLNAVEKILASHVPDARIVDFEEDYAMILIPVMKTNAERVNMRITRQDIIDEIAEMIEPAS